MTPAAPAPVALELTAEELALVRDLLRGYVMGTSSVPCSQQTLAQAVELAAAYRVLAKLRAAEGGR